MVSRAALGFSDHLRIDVDGLDVPALSYHLGQPARVVAGAAADVEHVQSRMKAHRVNARLVGVLHRRLRALGVEEAEPSWRSFL